MSIEDSDTTEFVEISLEFLLDKEDLWPLLRIRPCVAIIAKPSSELRLEAKVVRRLSLQA
jgi:hypothetical protein